MQRPVVVLGKGGIPKTRHRQFVLLRGFGDNGLNPGSPVRPTLVLAHSFADQPRFERAPQEAPLPAHLLRGNPPGPGHFSKRLFAHTNERSGLGACQYLTISCIFLHLLSRE